MPENKQMTSKEIQTRIMEVREEGAAQVSEHLGKPANLDLTLAILEVAFQLSINNEKTKFCDICGDMFW